MDKLTKQQLQLAINILNEILVSKETEFHTDTCTEEELVEKCRKLKY